MIVIFRAVFIECVNKIVLPTAMFCRFYLLKVVSVIIFVKFFVLGHFFYEEHVIRDVHNSKANSASSESRLHGAFRVFRKLC
jgi:hypothetical protein